MNIQINGDVHIHHHHYPRATSHFWDGLAVTLLTGADGAGFVLRKAWHALCLAAACGVYGVARIADGVLLAEKALGGGRTSLTSIAYMLPRHRGEGLVKRDN